MSARFWVSQLSQEAEQSEWGVTDAPASAIISLVDTPIFCFPFLKPNPTVMTSNYTTQYLSGMTKC